MSDENTMRQCFDDYAGRDGLLCKRELKKMIKDKMGIDFKLLHEVKKMFDSWDTDEDGKLNWEEFQEVAKKFKELKEMLGCKK